MLHDPMYTPEGHMIPSLCATSELLVAHIFIHTTHHVYTHHVYGSEGVFRMHSDSQFEFVS